MQPEPARAATGAGPAIEMTGIGKQFPGVLALADVDLTLEPGKVHALMGENGAGKSTLIKILAGVYQPDSGTIRIGGQQVDLQTPRDALRQGVKVVFQEIALIPEFTVAENIFLEGYPTGRAGSIDWKKIRDDSAALFERIGFNVDPADKVGNLPVSQQQMVEIARALAHEARIVVMDEPTSSLTPAETSLLFDVIRRLTDIGIAVLYVSHKLDEIFTICDHVVVMRDGRFVDGYPIEQATTGRIVADMVGRELSEIYPPHNATVGDVLMRIGGLSRRGEFADVNLDVRAGEVVALAGLIGAGRTELAKAVIGATSAEAGTVEMLGKTLRIRHPRDAMAEGVVYLSEDRKGEGLLLDHSIGENIVLSILKALARFGVLLPAPQREVIDRGMAELRVKAPSSRVAVSSLSGGNQQKVVLARLLATKARVFILDEPTRGVDIGAKAEIYKIIAGLTEAGRGVVLISSELPEVLGLAHRVALFREGQLVRTLERQEADAVGIMNVLTGAAT